MNITKVIAALTPKKAALTPKKAEEMVTILDRSIPGDSFEQLSKHKEEIAKLLEKKGLSDVVFYDPRRNLGEFDSVSIENRLAGCVELRAKNSLGISQKKLIEFFSAPNSEFMSKVYEKISDISSFINSPMLTTIKIDESIVANMSKLKIKYLTRKAMKAAEQMKISTVEITPTSAAKNSPLRLKLERVYDQYDHTTRSTCIDGRKVSTKKLLKKIKEFDGPEGINKISER